MNIKIKHLFVFASLAVLLLISGTALSASSENNVIFNDVNNPKTINQIKNEIGSIDEEDGDISNSIYIVHDNYTGNETEIGDYIIVFGVKDSIGIEVTTAITVRNVDVGKPYFQLASGSSLRINQYAVLNNNLPDIKAIDPYEGDISGNIVISGLSAINTTELGSYDLSYTVSDSSGNTTTEIFTLEVVDATAPEITGPSYIAKKASTILSGQFYMEYFTANDNIDGAVTSNIEITKNEYIGKASSIGTYEVILSISDIEGNTSTHILEIEVINEMIPSLIIDKYYWVVPSNHELSNYEFIQVLQKIQDLPNYTYMFTSIEDDYSNSSSTVGTYEKSFRLLSNAGIEYERDIIIKVIDQEENIIISAPDPQAEIIDTIMSYLPILLI